MKPRQEQPRPTGSPEGEPMTRREAFKALGMLAGIGGGIVYNAKLWPGVIHDIIRRLKGTDEEAPPERPAPRKIEAPEEMSREEMLEIIRQKLRETYPELESNFLPLTADPRRFNDDENVIQYFLLTNLEDLKNDGIITEERIDYFLEPFARGGMWERKIASADEAEETADQELCLAARDNLMEWQDHHAAEIFGADGYRTACKTALQNGWRIAAEQDIYPQTREMFEEYISHRVLLALTFHETGPRYDNPLATVAVYSALLNERIHLNTFPSNNDPRCSFGPFQLLSVGYEGGHRAGEDEHPEGSPYGLGEEPSLRELRELGSIAHVREAAGLPRRFHDCVELDDQLLAGALFTINNASFVLEDLLRVYSNDEGFWLLWGRADDAERERVLGVLIAAYHHLPATARDCLAVDHAPTLRLWGSTYIDNLRARNRGLGDYVEGVDNIFKTLQAVERAG